MMIGDRFPGTISVHADMTAIKYEVSLTNCPSGETE